MYLHLVTISGLSCKQTDFRKTPFILLASIIPPTSFTTYPYATRKSTSFPFHPTQPSPKKTTKVMTVTQGQMLSLLLHIRSWVERQAPADNGFSRTSAFPLAHTISCPPAVLLFPEQFTSYPQLPLLQQHYYFQSSSPLLIYCPKSGEVVTTLRTQTVVNRLQSKVK